MTALGVTHQQAKLLAFIRLRVVSGVSPTWSEMRDHMGFASKSSVSRLVEALIARGRLVRGPVGSKQTLALPAAAGVYEVKLPADIEAALLERSVRLNIPLEALIVSTLEMRFHGGRA